MGRSQAPYYFVLPKNQRDPSELKALVDLLQRHGVTVDQLNQATVVGDLHFEAGDIVVPLSQPYRTFVKEVMEDQRYPERHYTPGGELIRPYDITSWSLPRHMGVRSIQVDVRSEEFESRLDPVDVGAPELEIEVPEGTEALLLSPAINESYRTVFAALGKGLKVSRSVNPIERESGPGLPAGVFVISLDGVPAARVEEVLGGVTVPPVIHHGETPTELFPISLPRVALVETWFHDMDAGWTRYLFDNYGIPYTVLHPEDFDSADLIRNFDVIVFPDAGKDILTKGKLKRGDRYVSNDYPPKFRKPISKEGLGKLTAFIESGGSVVSWGGSTGLFTDGLAAPSGEQDANTVELPVRDVTKNLDGVSVPGAFVAVDFLPDHPLTWGMPQQSGAFSRGSPVFATSIPTLDTDRRVVATYPERDLLISGYLEGEKQLQNHPVMVWVRAGKGQLVLFGIRPQFRGSTPATFKLVFNALLLPPAQ
jgi:hypothetical protein